jgi:16S rRNA (cytidine1402-2'-O)-methyltransferase
MIAALAEHAETLLFYESPHRLKDTLAELLAVFGDRPAVAARELTKKFEQFVRGTLSSLQLYFNENTPRGEFTLVIAGNNKEQAPQSVVDPEQSLPLDEAVMALIQSGLDKKAAIREIALRRNIPKREVYQAVIGREG